MIEATASEQELLRTLQGWLAQTDDWINELEQGNDIPSTLKQPKLVSLQAKAYTLTKRISELNGQLSSRIDPSFPHPMKREQSSDQSDQTLESRKKSRRASASRDPASTEPTYQLISKQTRNKSSFYLPPSLGFPNLGVTQNGTAVRVPPKFWRSALGSDDYSSPEAIKFSFGTFPLNSKTAALHDKLPLFVTCYRLEFSKYLFDAVATRFATGGGDDTPSSVTASMNAILNIQMTWSWGLSGVHPGGCTCEPGGDQCSPRVEATYPNIVGNRTMQDIWQAIFDSIVDVLANDTMVRRLGEMKLPNRYAERDQELMKIAGLPASASSSVLGAMKKVQYPLYQGLTVVHHDCPLPVVECGKFSLDPYDMYPPRKSRRIDR